MELTRVNVKWEDGIWYPAMILRQINEKEVEVEFEDPDCPLEIVLISDTKAIEALNTPSIRPKAGAFNWDLFRIFCSHRTSYFDTLLTAQDLADIDLKASIFTAHAKERKEQRYKDNLQELLRSLQTNEFLAFRQTRRRIRKHTKPDSNDNISLQIKEPPNKEIVDVDCLRNSINMNNASDVDNNFETSKPCHVYDKIDRIHVITTTTRFVLNSDCSVVITVIKHKLSFRKWRKYYNRVSKLRDRNRDWRIDNWKKNKKIRKTEKSEKSKKKKSKKSKNK